MDKDLTRTVDGLIAEMAVLKITSDDENIIAATFLKRNKETQAFVKEWFEEERAKTYSAYKAVTDQIKFFQDKLTAAETAVKRRIADYQIQQEKKRREEERRLQEEARKAEEERRLQQAITTGDETILDKPVEPLRVVVEAPKKVDGVSFVEKWEWMIENTDILPREYMIPDERKIRGVVNAMKGNTTIPGVKVWADKTVRVSA